MGDNGGCMEVRAAATEAMGAVLLAVGPGAVPAAVWERALACAAGGFSLGGTELREAAHRFLGRVAGALDASFAPYLPVALPPALEALAHIGHGEEVSPGPLPGLQPGAAEFSGFVRLWTFPATNERGKRALSSPMFGVDSRKMP